MLSFPIPCELLCPIHTATLITTHTTLYGFTFFYSLYFQPLPINSTLFNNAAQYNTKNDSLDLKHLT
ncbi:hypothetical protein RJT34_06218 [Clitoria ternatea]|uniref:Uncharacterized protein n=1 Tax=Clitoria ternatea TaxID=43366 RepID=A0AAN9K203_CLITE